MSVKLQIGNNIRSLREKKGLNKRQFADCVGLFSPDYLGKMERGDVQEPKYSFLIGIGQFCRVSIDFILTGIEIPDNQNMNMQTQSAKEAMKHLDLCAKSIKKLDTIAYPVIKALEEELNHYQDPEVLSVLETFQPQFTG